MLNCITSGVEKSLGRNNNTLLGCKFALTKKKNGINCFQKMGNVDEYEMAEELMRMKKDNLCGFHFEMPKSIMSFKEPDILISLRTDEEWIKRIRQLMKQVNIREEDATVKVWGYNQKSNEKGQIEKKMRIDLHA